MEGQCEMVACIYLDARLLKNEELQYCYIVNHPSKGCCSEYHGCNVAKRCFRMSREECGAVPLSTRGDN